MSHTDLVVLDATVKLIATCQDVDTLHRIGKNLATEQLSVHDTSLLRAMWRAKRDWLMQQGDKEKEGAEP